MAEITDPQVIAFSNQELRPVADALFQAYYRAKELNQNYVAGNIGSLINTAGAGNLLHDGSEVDGRTRITGGDIYNFITLIGDFISFTDAPGRLDVITKPHVNGI